jgi:Ca2+-binding RTX toxin-like protein
MRRTILLLITTSLTVVLASGIALAVTEIGTDGPDTLRGTSGNDNLFGRGANDTIYGLGGSDNLLGEKGDDLVVGGNERSLSGGDKNLAGGAGNDVVIGGRGSDKVVGEDGDDLLSDGDLADYSKDELSSGDGDDLLLIHNDPAGKDVAVCGDGFDVVYADWKDEATPDCERVRIVVPR